MSFINRIKKALNPNTREGTYRGKVTVDEKDLRELLYHFERLDSDTRLNHYFYENNGNNYQLLRSGIEQMWNNNGKDSSEIMFLFTDELRRLQQEVIYDTPKYKVKSNFKL